MSSAAGRFFADAVWQEAWKAYHEECASDLSFAPEWVKHEYMKRARKAFAEYLADTKEKSK
jgi:hypothetical protein